MGSVTLAAGRTAVKAPMERVGANAKDVVTRCARLRSMSRLPRSAMRPRWHTAIAQRPLAAGFLSVFGWLIAALASVTPGVADANDFPTQARVEFVLGCMSESGGQSYDTLYPCVCLIDKIAAEMAYKEFAEAQVFSQLRSTPGERGGVFRDPEQAGYLREKLDAVTERGRAACFVNDQGDAGESDPDPAELPAAR